MNEESLARIARMEGIADECSAAVSALDDQLDRLDALRRDMKELFAYYGSAEWYADRELPLPPGTKAGVLSEDLLYDEITAVRALALRMLESATDLLKNRL